MKLNEIDIYIDICTPSGSTDEESKIQDFRPQQNIISSQSICTSVNLIWVAR